MHVLCSWLLSCSERNIKKVKGESYGFCQLPGLKSLGLRINLTRLISLGASGTTFIPSCPGFRCFFWVGVCSPWAQEHCVTLAMWTTPERGESVHMLCGKRKLYYLAGSSRSKGAGVPPAVVFKERTTQFFWERGPKFPSLIFQWIL